MAKIGSKLQFFSKVLFFNIQSETISN